MKAIVYTNYGTPDELKMEEVEKPAPTDDQILIKVHAVSLNGSDTEGLRGKPLYARFGGLRKPGDPILGSDIAGTVEYAGKNVEEFKPGDEVFGEIPGYHRGLAEFVSMHGNTLAHKPDSLSFEEAAAIPQAGVIALNGIRKKGRIQAGQKVLINGAGGSAGTFAVQLAKSAGAEITGVDNPHKQDYILSLGADHALDYTRHDFTRQKDKYDLILDLVAYRGIFAYPRALRHNGKYYCVGGSVAVLLQILLFGPAIGRATGKELRLLAVPQNRKDLLAVTDLCINGDLTPVIDRQYALEDTPEAFHYMMSGRAKGKIVIKVV